MKNMISLSNIEFGLKLIEQTIPDAKELILADATRAKFWVQEVLNNDPDRLEWHIKRLQGIGGSDVGPLVKELIEKETPAFMGSGAYHVVGRLLCKIPPSRPTWHQMLGSKLESEAREMIVSMVQQAGGSVDHESMDLMERWSANREFRKARCPELINHVGEPDLIVFLPEPATGKTLRILIDMKVDSTGKENTVIDEYIYQVNHYEQILSKGLGIKVDGLRISKLGPDENDLPLIRHFPVEIDPARTAKINQAIQITMDYRNRGVQPPIPIRPRPAVDDPASIADLMNEANNHYAWTEIEKIAIENKEQSRARLETLASSVSLQFDVQNQKLGSQGTLRLGNSNLSFSTGINLPVAVEALIAEGVIENEKQVIAPKGGLDESKVYELLANLAAQAGVPETEFVAQYKKEVFDEDAIFEMARRHFTEMPIPGLTQSYRIAASRRKDSGVEVCKNLARENITPLHELIVNQAAAFSEAEIGAAGKPKKPSAESGEKKASTRAKKDKSEVSF